MYPRVDVSPPISKLVYPLPGIESNAVITVLCDKLNEEQNADPINLFDQAVEGLPQLLTGAGVGLFGTQNKTLTGEEPDWVSEINQTACMEGDRSWLRTLQVHSSSKH